MNICLLSTVCWKDENKEKEAGDGPFFQKKEKKTPYELRHLRSYVLVLPTINLGMYFLSPNSSMDYTLLYFLILTLNLSLDPLLLFGFSCLRPDLLFQLIGSSHFFHAVSAPSKHGSFALWYLLYLPLSILSLSLFLSFFLSLSLFLSLYFFFSLSFFLSLSLSSIRCLTLYQL